MAANVKLKIDADTKDANFKLDALKQKTDGLTKTSILGKGVSSLNGNGKMATAMAELKGGFGDLASGVGRFTGALGTAGKALGVWGLAIAAVVKTLKTLYDQMDKDVQAGMPTANEHEKLSAKLGAQLGQYAVDPEPIIKQFQVMAENGVASASHLADAFIKLVPTLNGDAQAAVDLVARFADVEAATGITADSLTSLIGRIESTGEVDSKIIKQLEKKNIPIMRELARMYGTDAAGVEDMAKAHQIGVEQMQAALMKTTEMYAGTAAALSATTEGRMASMEAAIGRAKEAAAAAANELMRAYYQEEQARYDLLAASKEYQDQMRAEGRTVAEWEIVVSKFQRAWEAVLHSVIWALDKIGALDLIVGDDLDKINAHAIDTYLEQINRYKQIDSATHHDTNDLQHDLAEFRKAVALMEQNELDYDKDEAAKVLSNIERLIKAKQTEEAQAAEAQKKAAEAQKKAAQEQEEATKRQEAAAKEQAEAAAEGKKWYTQQLISTNAPASTVAESMGYTDDGWGFDPLDKAQGLVARLQEQAANGTISKQGLQDLQQAQHLLEYAFKQEQQYIEEEHKARMDAINKELQQKKLVGELRRGAKMSDNERSIYDSLYTMLKKLQESGLSTKEQKSILSKEMTRLLRGQIHGNADSITANGVARLKDFKFTDYMGVQAETLKEIKQHAETAKKQLAAETAIASKLPSPTMAQ